MSRDSTAEERGSASVLMVGVMAVVMVFAGVAVVVAGYLIGSHQAKGAADLSALSAAAVFEQAEDGCAQARRTAQQNGARVTRCDRVGDDVDFVVTVRVEVDVRTSFVGLPRAISAVAHAEPLR